MPLLQGIYLYILQYQGEITNHVLTIYQASCIQFAMEFRYEDQVLDNYRSRVSQGPSL